MRASVSTPTLPRLSSPRQESLPTPAAGSLALLRGGSASSSWRFHHDGEDTQPQPKQQQPSLSSSPSPSPSSVSPWIERYKRDAKSEFIDKDITEMLSRFQDLRVPPALIRKPLHGSSLLAKHATSTCFAGLDGDDEADGYHHQLHADACASPSPSRPREKGDKGFLLNDEDTGCGGGDHLRTAPSNTHGGGDGIVTLPGIAASRLRRQATKMMLQKRTTTTQTASDQLLKRTQFTSKIIPKRFLFDSTRWNRSTRCDYCQLAGGDLECATCDVIAHAKCFLDAYETTTKKTKGAFVVPTRFSWLCVHCQQGLQHEYDTKAKQARHDFIWNQKVVFGKVVKAYVRMTKDATNFKKKKESIVQIQAVIRGRIARVRYTDLQRMRLKPYAMESIKLSGAFKAGSSGGVGGATGVGVGVGEEWEDEFLRLANGFTCNPYVYVTVVDGDDDDTQLFCFETTVLRKGVAGLVASSSSSTSTTSSSTSSPSTSTPSPVSSSLEKGEICWKNDKLFIPGVNGKVTFCFTVLSKNGPNNFLVGQSVLRLKDCDSLWRYGGTVELPLAQEVEIFPRTAQRQTIRLADASPAVGGSTRHQLNRATGAGAGLGAGLGAGAASPLTLCVQIKPFSELHSHCGYLLTKNTIDAFQTSQRWCVLADGWLRIYRHYGVTLATETIEMAHTIDIKMVETTTKKSSKATTTSQNQNQNQNQSRRQGQDQWIAMEHLSRLFIFQSEKNRSATKQWLKKLQAEAAGTRVTTTTLGSLTTGSNIGTDTTMNGS